MQNFVEVVKVTLNLNFHNSHYSEKLANDMKNFIS